MINISQGGNSHQQNFQYLRRKLLGERLHFQSVNDNVNDVPLNTRKARYFQFHKFLMNHNIKFVNLYNASILIVQ
jgi:hypothetical protein